MWLPLPYATKAQQLRDRQAIMTHRPNLLDLKSDSYTSSNASTYSRPLRSPRLHVAGEAPPELSPLDAFAMQSRRLARQLQESAKEGNRMSRLPPLTDDSPLIVQGRSDYFRSMSYEDDTANSPEDGLGLRTEYEEFGPEDRPKSMHTRMSQVSPISDQPVPTIPQQLQEASRGRQLKQIEEDPDYFGARRERSPSPLNSDAQSQPDRTTERLGPRRDNSMTLPSPLQNASLPDSPEKHTPGSFDELGLPPPRGAFPHRASSVTSSPQMTAADEDTSSNLNGSFHSLPGARKLSSGSQAFANPLVSPALGHFNRSPSVSSDISVLPRPSFNFSRPLSRAGTPSFEPPMRLDTPSRQASSDSQPSFVLADDSVQTPVSMNSDAFLDSQPDDGVKSGAPSYIYSKFTLPRGKNVERSDSSENQSQNQTQHVNQPQTPSFNDQHMDPPRSVNRIPSGAPPSPPSRPSTASAKPVQDDAVSMLSSYTRPLTSSARLVPDDRVSLISSQSRPSMETSTISMESSRLGVGLPLPSRGRSLHESTRAYQDVSSGNRPRTSPAHDTSRGRTPTSAATSDTAGALRPPPTPRSDAPTASEMSAEEHLAKGIECHENGSLKESTYHLRHAARQNNPTAMLLYALACRHGWGMRPNQKEGVEWLRKAAEYASIEIADDEDQMAEGKHVDFVERRTRKAQFALSIYELGVSHMNGWGIEQDKVLALRCFEIAGTWGDVDALAETGFCYAQGIGCKKNLKKSAHFYRQAEAKGMSMVGNSWIHKAKYMEADKDNKKSPGKDKKKPRSKSRTRTMFGLKHT